MWKINRLFLFGLTIIMFGMASCDRDIYDEEKYKEIIRYLSPVDSVDQRQTWSLTVFRSYRLTADAGSDIESVKVFTENPLTSSSAELMNQTSISQGKTVALSVSVPSITTTLYAALVDKSGKYYVTPFDVNTANVSFVNATEGRPVDTITPQTFTYLFEEDFPEPGDYDYNDLVLRISQERTGKKELTINVTIAAVGGVYQMAGGIHLVGYEYKDIDSVKTVSGTTFNDGVPSGSLYIFDKTDNLIEGRNHEAIVNLFVDAHWAMAFNVSVDYGLFKRKKYNVSTGIDDNHQLRATRTISYVVYFASEEGLDNFTMDSLDPFIITEYTGVRMETHLDKYRDAQVLFEYPTPDIKDLPWALMVPMKEFAYPLEGVELGFRKKTSTGEVAMFGAYVTIGHSFGEWAENYLSSLDWYKYPDGRSVW